MDKMPCPSCGQMRGMMEAHACVKSYGPSEPKPPFQVHVPQYPRVVLNPDREERRFRAACAAMTALVAMPNAQPGWVGTGAVEYADALLAALERKPGEVAGE